MKRVIQSDSVYKLARRPKVAYPTGSSKRLNSLIQEFQFRRYLEVGVGKGKTLGAISASVRHAVDPMPQVSLKAVPRGVKLFLMTSDDFFGAMEPTDPYDLVFVDGLHEFRQSYRDTVNSLRHIGPDGLILVDDVVPIDDAAGLPSLEAAHRESRRRGVPLSSWMGDVYKTAVALRRFHPELRCCVIFGDGWREQLLVWKPDASTSVVAASDDALDEVAAMKPVSRLTGGLEDLIPYCGLDHAIGLVRASE